MDVIFFIAFIAAFAGVFGIFGYMGYKKTHTTDDYFVAGRTMGGLIIAFSYGATFISAVALIGFSGSASLYGHSILWLAFLNIFVGILIAFVIYGFRTRKFGLRLNAVTLPEILGNRFNSTRIQGVAGVIIAIFMVAYTSAVFLAIASLFEVSFGISYEICVVIFTIIVGIYLIMGGLYAVMWTHAVQGFLMLVGMAILTIWIYSMLGGLEAAHEAAASLTPEILNSLGTPAATLAPNGLTSMPSFLSRPFMTVLTLIFGVGIGVLAQPQLVTRYLTAKNERALRLAVPYGGVFILLMTFAAFSIGPLCNVLMAENGLTYPGTPDKVLPLIVTELFPDWFLFFFLFAILAAAMSTASSLFHTAGASIGRDVCEKGIMKGCSQKTSLLVTRLVTLLLIVITLVITLNPIDVVASMTAFFFGLMACTFLAPYTLMLYWKKISRAGAWAGMMGGFIFTMLWYSLVYFKTAPEIIGSSLVNDYVINMLDPVFIGIPFSFLLCVIVSILVKQDPEEQRIMRNVFATLNEDS
jgi:SSS family solute:Na+ symporter